MNMGYALHTRASVKWPRFPYPGLRPFRASAESDESVIFFGRTENKDDVLERLNASQFVSVVGPSGCGKSSLVKVGVIPVLSAGLLTRAGYDWVTLEMRPGQNPIGNLAGAFEGIASHSPGLTVENMSTLLTAERSGLWLLMDRLAPLLSGGSDASRPPRVLLVLDQFEEIFSGIQESDAVDQFVRLIAQFFRRPHPQLYIILTMRTDFIGQCANFPGLAEILNKTQYITPVLRGQGLRDAIARPAEAYWGEVEPALLDEVMRDMGAGSTYDADHLPLMQHALLWLWQQAWPRTGAVEPPNPSTEWPEMHPRVLLSLEDYRATGGLAGILNHHADTLYGRIRAVGEKTARITETMFRRLSERDASGRYKRAPALTSEVCTLAECTAEELRPAVDVFAAEEACFVEVRPGQAFGPQLDLSHESLIRQWRRLRDWADEEAEMLASFARIVSEAEAWDNQRRAPAFLKSGGQLEVQEQWWRSHHPSWVWADRYSQVSGKPGRFSSYLPLVETYREASRRAARNQSLRRSAAVIFVVLGIAAAGWVWHENQLQQTTEMADARSEAILGSRLAAIMMWSSREVAKGHASTALRITQQILVDTKLFDERPEVEALAYTELEQSREARLVTVANQFNATGYSPDGKWLVTVDQQRRICFIDVGSGECGAYSDPLPDQYVSARWNRDGSRLLLTGRDVSNLLLVPVMWRNSAPVVAVDQMHLLGDDPMARLGIGVFSPDGTLIATGGDGQRFRLWSAETGQIIASQSQPNPKSGFYLSINHDNTLIAEALTNGGVQLYHIDRKSKTIVPTDILKFIETKNGLNEVTTRSVEFHPNDPDLVLFNQGPHSAIMNVKSKRRVIEFLGGGGEAQRKRKTTTIVTQVAFSPDGKMVAVATSDGAVSAWNYRPGETNTKLPDLIPIVGGADGVPIYAVSFSPNGSQMVSIGRDGTLRIWNKDPAILPAISPMGFMKNASIEVYEDEIAALGSGAFTARGRQGSVKLAGLPAGFTPVLVEGDSKWIAVAPRTNADYTTESLTSHARDIALYRRDNLTSPVAWLDPAPADWRSASPTEWVGFAFSSKTVSGFTKDGRRFSWPVFPTRAALADFVKIRLPANDPDAEEIQYDTCLLGISITGCLTDLSSSN